MPEKLLLVLASLFFASDFGLLSCFHLQTERGSNRGGFRWNWRDWQELTADQSLRNTQIPYRKRKAIADAIANQIRPMMADLDIPSEEELQRAVLDTRVKLIDLDGDGIPEIVAQGMVDCGATGNCPFWVFRQSKHRYKLILEGEAQTFTIQRSSKGRFPDIVLSRHGSATSGDIAPYEYHEGTYHRMGCYNYAWEVLEGDSTRQLKEPSLTPCSERK